MKAGDRIRVYEYIMGTQSGYSDYTVEEFRFCLGIFLSDQRREAGSFTPLCELYERGPDSEEKYISNYGSYQTNLVQAWSDINKPEKEEQHWSCTKCGLDAHNCKCLTEDM